MEPVPEWNVSLFRTESWQKSGAKQEPNWSGKNRLETRFRGSRGAFSQYIHDLSNKNRRQRGYKKIERPRAMRQEPPDRRNKRSTSPRNQIGSVSHAKEPLDFPSRERFDFRPRARGSPVGENKISSRPADP